MKLPLVGHLKEPVSGLTHLLGAFLGLIGLLYLVNRALDHGTIWHLVSFSIYGVSLIFLYSSSAFYHLLDISPEAQIFFRRLDHAMIFILIAGSYTPFCLIPLRGPWGWTILGTVWVLGIAGVLLSIYWIDAPRKISTALYLLMGWMMIFAIYPLIKTLSVGGLYWLISGGLLYSVGAVIYAIKKPDPLPGIFGFHEIWHLFVLAGSFTHFLSVSTLIN